MRIGLLVDVHEDVGALQGTLDFLRGETVDGLVLSVLRYRDISPGGLG
jgi:hypothetical protein